MKLSSTLTSTILIVGSLYGNAFAQATSPLSFVQPLPSQSVQVVQERLRQAGVYSGAVDGVWGPDSAAALQRLQQNRQLQVTGQLNQATAATLGLDPRVLLETPQLSQTAATPPVAGSTLSSASIRTVQTRLRALNFYNGRTDGVWGQETQTAIERFQQGRGLQPNGQLNPATISAMGLPSDVLTYR